MERDFLGLGSQIITVKNETNDDSAPTKVMMDWSFLSNTGSASQLLSFGSSQQNKRRDLVNGRPSPVFTPTSIADQNRRTHYNSVQEVRMFPNSSQQDETTITASMSETGSKSFINSFLNHQHLGRSPNMATNIRSSPNPIGSLATQLTIFYAGSVSVYQDITPEKAQSIMLLARNEPQTKAVPHSPATTCPPTMPPTFLPSICYSVSQSNKVIALEPNKTPVSLGSKHNNQTDTFIMAPTVGLKQTRKASLARFIEKRKERVINVSPYNLDYKSSVDGRTSIWNA